MDKSMEKRVLLRFERFEYAEGEGYFFGLGVYTFTEAEYERFQKALERLRALKYADINIDVNICTDEVLHFSSGGQFLACLDVYEITPEQYENLVRWDLRSVNIEQVYDIIQAYMPDTAYISFEFEDMKFVRTYPMDKWVEVSSAYRFLLQYVDDEEAEFDDTEVSFELDLDGTVKPYVYEVGDFMYDFVPTMIDEREYNTLLEVCDNNDDTGNKQTLLQIFDKLTAV